MNKALFRHFILTLILLFLTLGTFQVFTIRVCWDYRGLSFMQKQVLFQNFSNNLLDTFCPYFLDRLEAPILALLFVIWILGCISGFVVGRRHARAWEYGSICAAILGSFIFGYFINEKIHWLQKGSFLPETAKIEQQRLSIEQQLKRTEELARQAQESAKRLQTQTILVVQTSPTPTPIPLPEEHCRPLQGDPKSWISYDPAERIISAFNQSLAQVIPLSESESISQKSFTVGTLQAGPCQGAKLILAESYFQDPDGASYEHYRYLQKDLKMIFLPKISDPPYFLSLKVSLYQDYEMAIDNEFDLPELAKPNLLEWPQSLKKISYVREIFSKLGSTSLIELEPHPSFGNFYTTIPNQKYDLDYFVIQQTDGPSDADLEHTRLNSNDLYHFRSDQTFLIYKFYPQLEIPWGPHYTFFANNKEDASIVNTQIIPMQDLVEIGKTKDGRHDPLYTFKDKRHKLLVQFYDQYKKMVSDHQTYLRDRNLPERKIISYDEFHARVPIFFWRDPFGRLMRFARSEFLNPYPEP